MVFDDAVNKAKNFAKGNPDKVDQGLDAASEQVKNRVGDEHHDKIDSAGDAARDHLGLGDQGGQNQGAQNQGGNRGGQGGQGGAQQNPGGGQQNRGGGQGGGGGATQNQGGNQSNQNRGNPGRS